MFGSWWSFTSFRQTTNEAMLRENKGRGDRVRAIGENTLPSQFLRDPGVYLQTAAHIESEGWQTVMHADGIDVRSRADFLEYVELKRHTRDLLARYRACADRCPDPIAAPIRAAAKRVEDGLETRNLAAHGAFFWDDEQAKLRAVHYFSLGSGKDRELFQQTGHFTLADIQGMLDEASQLLHEVSANRQAVVEWRHPKGLPKPSGAAAD